MKTDTLETMEAEGYEGPDASLNESLVEYGLAWKQDDGDWLFIYQSSHTRKRFDWGSVRIGADPFKEWDWALRGDNLTNFLSSQGMTVDEWKALPLPQQVYDLVNYHGVQNIFGESYSEGFKIAGLEW